MIESIGKDDFTKVTQTLGAYKDQLEMIQRRTYPLKAKVRIQIDDDGGRLEFAPTAPFEMEVPFLLAVISGSKLFWEWLQRKYPDGEGGVQTNFGFRIDKYVPIAFQAIKYIVIGLIKAVNKSNEQGTIR